MAHNFHLVGVDTKVTLDTEALDKQKYWRRTEEHGRV